MSLRIDVRTPPQLIERAREQQQQQRLAMVERQRQARVRKEAERQVVRERLLTGRNEKGEKVTDGIEMRRRDWFGAQAVQRKHRVAVVRVEYIGSTSNYTTREGKLIYTTSGRPGGSLSRHYLRLLLPVNGETAILVTGVRGTAGLVASDTYIFNAGNARKLGVDGRKLFPDYVNGYFPSYGMSNPVPTVSTPKIYEWPAPQGVLPQVALIHNSNRTGSSSPYIISWYTTGKVGQTDGLPDGWYQNLSQLTYAPPENSAYWKDLQVKLPRVLWMNHPTESEPPVYRSAYYCWDWGQPAYCRQQLLALGFAPEDLVL
jgi:hypothetical protein